MKKGGGIKKRRFYFQKEVAQASLRGEKGEKETTEKDFPKRKGETLPRNS